MRALTPWEQWTLAWFALAGWALAIALIVVIATA